MAQIFYHDSISISSGDYIFSHEVINNGVVGIPTASLIDTLSLDDSWNEQVNPDNQSVSDSLSLSDIWSEQVNPDTQLTNDDLSLLDTWLAQITPDNQSASDSLSLSDAWDVHILAEYLEINESVLLNDSWNVKITPEEQSLIDSISLSDSWSAFITPEQISFSDELSLFDVWNETLTGTFKIHVHTDLRWLEIISKKITTSLAWILVKSINLDLRWLSISRKQILTDLRWLTNPYTIFTPITHSNIQIFINGTDVLLGNDVDVTTGNIAHTVGQKSIANFTLARKHDDLDRTHLGIASQITNQNPIQIYIDGHLEFDGNVSTLAVNSENETVQVTALMDEPADNRHSISLPLPSVNEIIHPYHCLVNNVQIDNPKEDTRAVIIGANGRYWNGSNWVYRIEDAMVFTTDNDAQLYITNYNDLTVTELFDSQQPSVTSREKTPQYYKGVKVNLGTKIQQQVDRWRDLEYIFNGKGMYATQIEEGTFITKPNYSYFWAVLAKNVITGVYNGDYRYLGTSLASTTTDLWVLNGVVPMRQKIKDNIETDLGYYYVGSAPYKEISPKNGILIPAAKWQDKDDGLYDVLNNSYNYENYAKIIANIEYQKLLNVGGGIIPITSANVEITFDAYYYYTIKLLTRVNVTNTTVANTYKNTNGFPTSVKGININFSTMKITLTTDNRLSQEELDELEATKPDETNYEFPETAIRVYRKFDLKTWQFVS